MEYDVDVFVNSGIVLDCKTGGKEEEECSCIGLCSAERKITDFIHTRFVYPLCTV